MKKYIFLMAFLLTACAGEAYPAGTPTPTPNAGEIALQMMQEKVAAEGTQMAVGLQFTATAQVIGMTVTSQAISTQEAITQQARADAQATSDQFRRDAAATQQRKDDDAATEQARQDIIRSTEQAIVDIRNTQSADSTSTFTVMTLTAMPAIGTATALGINNQIVIDGKNVEQAELDLQQSRDTNKIEWAIPLLVALVALGAGLLWVVRKSRWNPIMDDNGELAGFGFDEIFVRPNALPGSVLDLKAKPMPLLTDTATQKELLINEQRIRAIAAMPVSPASGSTDLLGLFNSRERFEMGVPPTELLPEETVKAIDADWKETNDG